MKLLVGPLSRGALWHSSARILVTVVFGSALGWGASLTGPAMIGVVLILGVLVIAAPMPYVLPVLLGAGLVLGGRIFSYIYVPMGPLPLFVTEAILGTTAVLAALRIVFVGREDGLRRSHFVVFLGLMLVVGLGMLRDFDLLKTGRNSVILLYSIFYIAPVVFIRTPWQLWTCTKVFVAVTTLKSLIYMGDASGMGLSTMVPLFLRQLADTRVDMMWAAVSAILVGAVFPLVRPRSRKWSWIALLSCLWVVVYVESRSMWTGLMFAGAILGATVHKRQLIHSGHRRMALALAVLFMVGGTAVHLIEPAWIASRVAEVGTLTGATVENNAYRYANVSVRIRLWTDMWNELSQSWSSLLFGVGFGKAWIPELARVLTSPTYGPLAGGQIWAPHNSQLMILYRVGAVGFVIYAVLILTVAHSVFRSLTTGPQDLRLLVAALLASLAYVLFHSLTDVVLESPYRGVVVWLLLGFCQAGANVLKGATSECADGKPNRPRPS